MPANQVAIALASPGEQVATAQGLFSATGTLVSGLVALASGVLYEREGPQLTYTAAAVAMIVFLGLSLLRSAAADPTDLQANEPSEVASGS